MTKLADDPQTEQAKKTLEQERKATEQSRAEFAERSKGKPTPTQEENDLANLGAHILEHEHDGSDPDPHNGPIQGGQQGQQQNKQLEADKQASKPQNYQTRQHKAE
jgi:hypothetical protein